jgi:hypothetical protein
VANAETTLQQQIRLALGSRTDLRLFRNQVGQLPDPRTGRLVQFGLARGSADLIGWRTVVVTPEMVGQRIAVFTSIEVKTPTGRVRSEQQAWLGCVRGAGGIAGIARSVGDGLQILNLPLGFPSETPALSHEDTSATAHHHPRSNTRADRLA